MLVYKLWMTPVSSAGMHVVTTAPGLAYFASQALNLRVQTVAEPCVFNFHLSIFEEFMIWE